MNVLIIEDEARSARLLERMLTNYDPAIRVLAQLPSVSETIAWFQARSTRALPMPDLVLLDIHLEDGLAFGIFEQLSMTVPVIFTTAYDDYMIRAFKVNSVDYLLKPIDEDELANALTKFKTLRSPPPSHDLTQLLEAMQSLRPPAYKERFMISLGAKIHSIETSDIAYFYAEEKATFLMTRGGLLLPLEQSLDQLSSQVNPAQFFRVNRQFLIGRSAIQTIQTYSTSRLRLSVQPASRQEIFVSVHRLADFKDWLGR